MIKACCNIITLTLKSFLKEALNESSMLLLTVKKTLRDDIGMLFDVVYISSEQTRGTNSSEI